MTVLWDIGQGPPQGTLRISSKVVGFAAVCLLGWILNTGFLRMALTLQHSLYLRILRAGITVPNHSRYQISLTNGGEVTVAWTLVVLRGGCGGWNEKCSHVLEHLIPSRHWCLGDVREPLGGRSGNRVWEFIAWPHFQFSYCFLCAVKMWSLKPPALASGYHIFLDIMDI